MAVAEILRGVVFREVPGVHEGVGIEACGVGFSTPDIDLTGAGFAVAVGRAGGIQATTEAFLSAYSNGKRIHGMDAPGIPLRIHSRERNAASIHLQRRLVGLVNLAFGPAGNGGGKADDLVMADDLPGVQVGGLREEREECKSEHSDCDRWVLFLGFRGMFCRRQEIFIGEAEVGWI